MTVVSQQFVDFDDVRMFDLAQNFNFVLEQRVSSLTLRVNFLHYFGCVLDLCLFTNGNAYFAEATFTYDVTERV